MNIELDIIIRLAELYLPSVGHGLVSPRTFLWDSDLGRW